MGITMARNTRRWTIIIVGLLLIGSGGISAWWFSKPETEEKEVPVYTCTQQAQVDYQVFLVKNQFFSEMVVGPGQAYITQLTQYIETVLNYSYIGETPVDISGEYQVDAKLTGYILKDKGNDTTEKEKIKAWGKNWELIPPTSFAAYDNKLFVKQQVPIDIKAYSDFASQVAKELKFSADVVELTVTYSIQGGALTPAGEIREPVKVVMTIPVEGSAFMIEGVLSDQKDKSVNQSRISAIPGIKTARTGFACATALFALLLLLIIFKTTAEKETPSERELRRIIKKYGDRIVTGFSWVPALSANNTLALKTFDDLVKVADEVGQPILYEKNQAGIDSFYVIDEPLIYSVSLPMDTEGDIYIDGEIDITQKADT